MQWNRQRRKNAEYYEELLSSVDGVVVPFEPSWSRAVYHLYIVRVQDRQEMQAYLKDAGVGTGIHYPIPLHLQEAYRYLDYRKGDFPVAERIAPEILSLPMYPQLQHSEQETVARAVKDCLLAVKSI